jgi:trehalose 6-phosphate phosphatase
MRLGLDRPDIVPIYIGDDLTDEDALAALDERGVGIVVRGEDDARRSAARYALADPDDVRRFLELLVALAGDGRRP